MPTGVLKEMAADWERRVSRKNYGQLLWANPATRARLLRHWKTKDHPYHERFASYCDLLEKVLAPETDDVALDAAIRSQGHSLRTVVREIPPVFGSI